MTSNMPDENEVRSGWVEINLPKDQIQHDYDGWLPRGTSRGGVAPGVGFWFPQWFGATPPSNR